MLKVCQNCDKNFEPKVEYEPAHIGIGSYNHRLINNDFTKRPSAYLIVVINDNQEDDPLEHIVARECDIVKSAHVSILFNSTCQGCYKPYPGKTTEFPYTTYEYLMPNILESIPFAKIFTDLETAKRIVADMKTKCRMHGNEFVDGIDSRYVRNTWGVKLKFKIVKVSFGFKQDRRWACLV